MLPSTLPKISLKPCQWQSVSSDSAESVPSPPIKDPTLFPSLFVLKGTDEEGRSLFFRIVSEPIKTLVGNVFIISEFEKKDNTFVPKKPRSVALCDQETFVLKRTSKKFLEQSRIKGLENPFKEMQVMKHLSVKSSHPGRKHVIEVYHTWSEDDHLDCIMERGCAGDLFDLIQDNPDGLRLIDATRIVHEILLGLSYMHSRGVCHRDISPENVFLSSRLTAKIGDFGAATCFEDGKLIPASGGCKENWSAPEMFAKLDYDGPACDAYSVGAVYFALLFGFPAYEEPSDTNAKFEFIRNGKLRDLILRWQRERGVRYVPSLEMDLLTGLMEFNPCERLLVDDALEITSKLIDIDIPKPV